MNYDRWERARARISCRAYRRRVWTALVGPARDRTFVKDQLAEREKKIKLIGGDYMSTVGILAWAGIDCQRTGHVYCDNVIRNSDHETRTYGSLFGYQSIGSITR